MTLWSWRIRVEPGGRRATDLLYVALGVIPGAIVGGRLVHALSFGDTYLADPAALFDLSRGSLSLVGAVIGGGLSGVYVCRLLGRSLGRWADAAAVPLLIAIGLGKIALLLGGGGQGAPFDGAWAVAFSGAGPWISPDAAIAAHPAQVYEGVLTLLGLPVTALLAQRSRRGRPERHVSGRIAGIAFLAAIAWWLAVRSLVGFTWRDEPMIGPLGGEQVATLLALLAVLVAIVWLRRQPPPALNGVSWGDPTDEMTRTEP